MVSYRFGSAVVVALAVSVLGSFGTDSHLTTLATAQQSINAQGYAPHQAIVFDGSAEASRTYLVALSKAGFLTQFVKIPFTPCSQVIQEPQWAIQSLGVPGRGIFIPDTFHFDAAVFPRPPGPSVSPFDPTVLRTDCDVLANFAAVQQYLSEVQAKAEQVQSQVDECLNKVRALHCQIAATIENAPVIPSAGELGTADIGVDSSPSDPSFSGCGACAEALATLPQRLDSLESEVGKCTAQFGELSNTLNWINLAIRPLSEGGQGGLSLDEKQNLQEEIDRSLAHAEEASVRASQKVAALEEVGPVCALDQVTASCEACSPATGPRHRSRAVLVEWNRQPIGRLVGAFHAAAQRADSAELADRLSNLAFRLHRLPDDRVLHVTFKTTSLISQDLVALAPPPGNVADNRRAPLAIVLTGLNRDAPLPAMTANDQRLVFDAMRAFYDLVVPQHK